jgi:rod shape determining protein RodA
MIKSHFRFDWILAASIGVLIIFGLLMMISLSPKERSLLWFWRQILWVILGIILFYFLSSIDYRIFRNSALVVILIYLFSIFLLILVLIFGTTINGAKSWFSLWGVLFQPVEIVKISLVLLLAKYYSTKNIELWNFKHIIITGLYMVIPVILVALQPDLGSDLVLFLIWLGMTTVSGIRRGPFIAILALLMILSFILWGYVLNERQKTRIIAVFRPEAVSYAALYNIQQAEIAVGAGGLFGEGLGHGSQAQLRFLPAAKTDFIFAALSQESGFLGITILIFSFGIVFWRIIDIALGSSNNFARLFSVGFFIMLSSHVIINIAMNLGIFPVIGISLPFVSYGGSNMLANFIGLGILFSIKRYSFSFIKEQTLQ